MSSGRRLNIKTLPYLCRDFHNKDSTVSLPSYHDNRNPYTRKDDVYIETGPGSLSVRPSTLQGSSRTFGLAHTIVKVLDGTQLSTHRRGLSNWLLSNTLSLLHLRFNDCHSRTKIINHRWDFQTCFPPKKSVSTLMDWVLFKFELNSWQGVIMQWNLCRTTIDMFGRLRRSLVVRKRDTSHGIWITVQCNGGIWVHVWEDFCGFVRQGLPFKRKYQLNIFRAALYQHLTSF